MNKDNLIIFLFIGWIVLYIINGILHKKYKESKSKILKFLDFIVSIPIIIILNVQPILMILIPIILIYTLINFTLALILNNKLSIYLTLLLLFYITAYKSYYIINIMIKLQISFYNGFLHRYIAYKSIDVVTNINLRKYNYFVAIFLYITSRIVLFYEIDISNLEQINLILNVIGEVVLTFLYVDGYITNFKPQVISENEKKLLDLKNTYLSKFKESIESINI